MESKLGKMSHVERNGDSVDHLLIHCLMTGEAWSLIPNFWNGLFLKIVKQLMASMHGKFVGEEEKECIVSSSFIHSLGLWHEQKIDIPLRLLKSLGRTPTKLS